MGCMATGLEISTKKKKGEEGDSQPWKGPLRQNEQSEKRSNSRTVSARERDNCKKGDRDHMKLNGRWGCATYLGILDDHTDRMGYLQRRGTGRSSGVNQQRQKGQ